MPQPVVPRPRFQAPPVVPQGRGTTATPMTSTGNPGLHGATMAGMTTMGARPMRPPPPVGHIPSAPTTHYGPTTPFDDHGIPITPIIPTLGSNDTMGRSGSK